MDSALKVIQVRDEEATVVIPSDKTDDTEAVRRIICRLL